MTERRPNHPIAKATPTAMRLSVYPSARTAAAALARDVAARLKAQPDLVLGLPTGRTPVPLYRELVALHRRGEADFSRAATFNLDEFLGIGADHPGSYRQFMERRFFGHVNLRPDRINFLNGLAPNPEAECARYEEAIREAGGIDLMLVGIGTNGHVGFNEPARELQARSHRVRLHASTRRANATLFGGDPDRVPAEALSVGMATILDAREVVLLATGKSKAPCVARLVSGSLTTRMPASFLQLHPRVALVLDGAAASSLSS